MMGSYGDFPASGYYAACNSFPRNTSVEVANLENGRSITVIVTKGLESSGIFMMLSVEAAGALGLQSGRVTRVRASEPKSAVELAPSGGSRGSYDPDLNPRLLAAQELKRLGYELEPAATVATAQKPAVSNPRVEPAPAVVPPPVAAEPVATPAAASVPAVTPPVTAPTPEITSPTSTAPESLAATKPKPVRTIILPQLPDPAEPIAKAIPETATPSIAPAPEAKPEAFAIVLPEPDETPLRVEPSSIPKRYEAPSLRPDISSGGLRVPSAPDLAVAMLDPFPVEDARAAAFARSAPELRSATASAELYDPSVPDSESAAALARLAPGYADVSDGISLIDPSLPGSGRADAIARLTPRSAPAGAMPELVWPELEADEIPEVLLASLVAPVPEIPATSLAEGEIILPLLTGPAALALETPEYGAAETTVALEDAEVEATETPIAESLAGLAPYGADGSYDLAEAEARDAEKPYADGLAATAPVDSANGVGLAEAAEQKPETTPLLAGPEGESAPTVALDSPKEYIIAMEPTGPKPPVLPGAPLAPVVKSTPPSVTVAPPITVAPAASIATISEALEKGRYYIQVGAYGSEAMAKDSAGKLKTGYAILIQKTSAKGKDTWRLYVGPLSRDESGVALVRVRAMGYKDAFVKSGS